MIASNIIKENLLMYNTISSYQVKIIKKCVFTCDRNSTKCITILRLQRILQYKLPWSNLSSSLNLKTLKY